MEKREKIIMIVVVVAAVYGAIDFTLTTNKKKAALTSSSIPTSAPIVSSTEVDALITDDSKKIAKIAASINETWPSPIFTTGSINFDGEKKIDLTREALLNELKGKVSQLFYSGFVSMNDDRIAIVNGMDYRVGEQIEGFTISKITMDAVHVTANDANFEIPASIEIPPSDPAPIPGKPEQN